MAYHIEKQRHTPGYSVTEYANLTKECPEFWARLQTTRKMYKNITFWLESSIVQKQRAPAKAFARVDASIKKALPSLRLG